MANNEHVEQLKKGVDAWNTWRGKNESVMIDLVGADLREATLTGADLTGATLSEATLAGVRFIGAQLVNTNLENTNLTGYHVYGVSAWNLMLKEAQQRDLIITPEDEPVIEVDNIEVGQFIYLLLHNTADLTPPAN